MAVRKWRVDADALSTAKDSVHGLRRRPVAGTGSRGQPPPQRAGLAGINPGERIVIADPTKHAVYLVCPERKEILRLAGTALDDPAPVQAPLPHGVKADLGEKVIAGVNARGVRSEVTVPAGAQGNEKPLVHKSETWFSPDLATIVSMRMSMPEIGDFYMHVENLKFGDMPASTFALPEGYAIRDIALHE